MTAALHHTSLVTREHDRIVGFLVAALDFDRLTTITVPRSEIADLFGWPDGEGMIRSSVMGSGRQGLLEIVDVPDAGEPAPAALASGLFQVSVAVGDLAGVLERAVVHGADAVTGPRTVHLGGVTVEVGVIDISGLRVQVTQAG